MTIATIRPESGKVAYPQGIARVFGGDDAALAKRAAERAEADRILAEAARDAATAFVNLKEGNLAAAEAATTVGERFSYVLDGRVIARRRVTNGTGDAGGNSVFLAEIPTLAYFQAINANTFNAGIVGVTADGVTNDLPAVLAAAAVAGDRTLTFPSGRLKLVGSDNITITGSVDMLGTVIDASAWTGKFIVARSETKTTYLPAGADGVVAGLTGSADLTGKSCYYSGWDGLAAVEDSFVLIYTDQDFYTYRGNVQKRFDLNRSLSRGMVRSPSKYTLEGVTVTSVVVIPMEKQRRVLRVNIDMGTNTSNLALFDIQTSRIDLDINIVAPRGASTANPVYVTMTECAEVSGRIDLSHALESTNATSAFTYGIQMSRCYDIDLELRGDGAGWGVTGNNDCQRVTIRNSTINRLDFHRIYREWLHVIDSEIGVNGIVVTGIGDLILDNVTFKHTATPATSGGVGVISSRNDTGGFVDGDLIARNLNFTGDFSASEVLIHNQIAGNPKPVGSPINYRWFRDILIDGIRSHQGDIRITPSYVSVTDAVVGPAESVTIKGARGLVSLRAYAGAVSPQAAAGTIAQRLLLDDCELTAISLADAFGGGKMRLDCRNVRPVEGGTMDVTLSAPIDARFWGGEVNKFTFTGVAGAVDIECHGTRLNDRDGGTYFLNAWNATHCKARFIGGIIEAANSGRVAFGFANARIEGSRILLAGVAGNVNLTNDLNGAAGPLTIYNSPDVSIPAGQRCLLTSGLSGTPDNACEVEFRMPAVGQSVLVNTQMTNGDGSVVSVKTTRLKRTAAQTLTLIDPGYIRRVSIPSA